MTTSAGHEPSPTDQEFVPSMQQVAGLLSVVIGIVLAGIGNVLLFFPTSVVSFILNHDTTTSALDLTLSRMTGGIILGQGLWSFVLLFPLLHEWRAQMSYSCASVDKCRAAVSLQCLTGLMFVIVGLIDDRASWTGNKQLQSLSLWTLGPGFGIMITTCIGLMCSYWPVVESDSTNETQTNPQPPRQQQTQEISGNNPGRIENAAQSNEDDGDRVPLLQASEENNQDDEETSGYQLLIDESNTTTNNHDGESDDNEDESTSRIRGTRRLLKLAAPEVLYLYLGCAVLLIRLPFSLSIPHFISTTLGAVSRGDFVGARWEIMFLFILGSIDAALDFWCVFLFGYTNVRIVRGVRLDAFAAILKQEIGFFDNHTSGELASRLSSDCGAMAGDLTWFFRFSIESVVRLVGISAYMLIRCPILGACALSIIPVVAAVNKWYGDWLGKNSRQVQDALAKANSVANEAFSCIRTVIAFASEEFEYKKYEDRIDHQYRLNVRQLFMTGFYYMFISTFLINTVVQSALLLIGTHLIQRGRLTGEVLLAFMLYQGQLQSETLNLFQSYSSLIRSSGAGDKVFALLDRSPRAPGTGSEVVRASDGPVEANDESMNLKLENVHFRYPSRPEQTVLQSLDLEISRGQTVALVGPSGCGKSTIVGLLQRFYDPTAGRILVDNVDVKAVDVKAHRIGVVTQDPILFHGTIMSNIVYGIPGATREKAIEAAKLANAHNFISSFPNGYDTEVGERGVQLSGGQKQRIAISRAVIRNPALLLLDEATSALDTESEQIVQEALDKLITAKKSITTVIIAHRLQTVRNADVIAVIQEGRLVEQGTHEWLMELKNGYYKTIVEKSLGDRLAVA